MSVESAPLPDEHRRVLLKLAADVIAFGIPNSERLAVKAADFPEELAVVRASFVTLRLAGKLRGCVGTLEATRPLVLDVAKNAFAAAFQDPRFAPLSIEEFLGIDIHLSLLTTPEPIEFRSEADLLGQIRPGVDGLILVEASQRGTLIPAFWNTEPDAKKFLQCLKRKAGLPVHYWSDSLRVLRYTAESVHH